MDFTSSDFSLASRVKPKPLALRMCSSTSDSLQGSLNNHRIAPKMESPHMQIRQRLGHVDILNSERVRLCGKCVAFSFRHVCDTNSLINLAKLTPWHSAGGSLYFILGPAWNGTQCSLLVGDSNSWRPVIGSAISQFLLFWPSLPDLFSGKPQANVPTRKGGEFPCLIVGSSVFLCLIVCLLVPFSFLLFVA